MKLVNFFFCQTGKNLFGQVNFQTLSERLSCKVWETFVKTGKQENETKGAPETCIKSWSAQENFNKKYFTEPLNNQGKYLLKVQFLLSQFLYNKRDSLLSSNVWGINLRLIFIYIQFPATDKAVRTW